MVGPTGGVSVVHACVIEQCLSYAECNLCFWRAICACGVAYGHAVHTVLTTPHRITPHSTSHTAYTHRHTTHTPSHSQPCRRSASSRQLAQLAVASVTPLPLQQRPPASASWTTSSRSRPRTPRPLRAAARPLRPLLPPPPPPPPPSHPPPHPPRLPPRLPPRPLPRPPR